MTLYQIRTLVCDEENLGAGAIVVDAGRADEVSERIKRGRGIE
jgi:hypothetical protein